MKGCREEFSTDCPVSQEIIYVRTVFIDDYGCGMKKTLSGRKINVFITEVRKLEMMGCSSRPPSNLREALLIKFAKHGAVKVAAQRTPCHHLH